QQSVGAGIFSSAFLLSILIWLPVIVAVGIAIMPNPRGRYDTLIKQIAFFANLVTMFILFIAYHQFENFLPTMQYEEKIAWLPAIGVTYHLGVDGPGIAMLMLSGLVGIASVLASIGIRDRVRTYFALLLLAQASANGAIVARAMIVAGATRLPLFPLHGWLRDALAEAPVGVAVVVSGAASRLGAFLLLRVVIGAEPAAAHLLSPVLAALAALTVGYAALAAIRS